MAQERLHAGGLVARGERHVLGRIEALFLMRPGRHVVETRGFAVRHVGEEPEATARRQRHFAADDVDIVGAADHAVIHHLHFEQQPLSGGEFGLDGLQRYSRRIGCGWLLPQFEDQAVGGGIGPRRESQKSAELTG